jgi:hypothetical protein
VTPSHTTRNAAPTQQGASVPTLLAKPATQAHELLGVPLDPYVVRPQEVLRRAFDELAFALHYFVVGAMVASRGEIFFSVTNELVASEVEPPVYTLPKITRKENQNPKYQLRSPDQWKGTDQGYHFDGDADAAEFQRFRKCIHTQEVGFLLQHVAKMAENPKASWGYLFGRDTSSFAENLFVLRNYLVHRNYLAEGRNHCAKVAQAGRQVFKLMLLLLDSNNGLQSKFIGSIFIAKPFNDHLKNLEQLKNVFDHLCSTIFNSKGASKHKGDKDLVAVLAHLQAKDDTGSPIPPDSFFWATRAA